MYVNITNYYVFDNYFVNRQYLYNLVTDYRIPFLDNNEYEMIIMIIILVNDSNRILDSKMCQ